MDLSKIAEVDDFIGPVFQVNELLEKGWILLTVKVVERQYREGSSDSETSYIRKEEAVCYVVGRPRTVPPES